MANCDHRICASLMDAHGPLTASSGLAPDLKGDGADTNIFNKHLALEAEIVGSPLVVGNKSSCW